jgi:hypothetical protein
MPDTTNTNSPVPSWVGGAAHPGGGAPAGAGGPQQSPGWVGDPAAAPGGVTQAQPQTKAAGSRPSGLVLAGAGSLLAVLAFLGGTAVGHAWGGSSGTTPTQFGPGGGGRQFPGQQGQVPGQGPQGTVPGQGQGQGTVPGQGQQSAPGQTRTS